MKSSIFTFSICILVAGCAHFDQVPKFSVAAPTSFADSLHYFTIHRGEVLDKCVGIKASDTYYAVSGRWENCSFVKYKSKGTYYGGAKFREWNIEVLKGVSNKIANAFKNAKDGYEADLGETYDASARIYPRFERKKYKWGNAMSYFVQYQNDNTNFVPNNGMLTYEVVGFTTDFKYTIRASFGVTHPKLKEFGPGIRDYPDDTFLLGSPMRKDSDYILVERCPASDFQPSLDDIDKFLNTVSIH